MTKDQDFKALVRARMAKTGESYATARQRLIEQEAGQSGAGAEGAGQNSGPSEQASFGLARDRSAVAAAQERTRSLVEKLMTEAGVALDDEVVRVWMGDPPTFTISIPRSAIASVDHVPDHPPGTSLGVHGRRGRWLVNAAYTDLVRLRLDPPVRAQLKVQASLPADVRARTPRILRPLLWDRTPRVRELTISVDDPDAFVTAVRAPR